MVEDFLDRLYVSVSSRKSRERVLSLSLCWWVCVRTMKLVMMKEGMPVSVSAVRMVEHSLGASRFLAAFA